MRKTVGSAVTIDTNPPYRQWDGNQATYLFFPTFTAFLLVLLSGLSEPIIQGISIAKIDTGVNGTLSVGTWGWCTRGVPGYPDMCSGNRSFNEAMSSELDALPEPLKAFMAISGAVPGSYLVANGVFLFLAALAIWMTVTFTLAASGYWHNREVWAWSWTKWTFHATGLSAIFILIAWALELGMITRIAAKTINPDGSQPTVIPGPAIWMMMTAFILCLGTWIVRVTYLHRMPRPRWTIKGAGGDFHHSVQPLLSALPAPDEQPPSWESLNAHHLTAPVEKAPLDDHEMLQDGDLPQHLSIDQRGFSV